MAIETMKTRRPLHYFRAWLGIGWLLVAAVVFLTLTPSPPRIEMLVSDKLQHGLSYTCLMLWFGQIYQPGRYWRIAAALTLLGMALEVLQGISGLRHFEYLDMLANSIGVLTGWGLSRTPLGALLLGLEQRLGVPG